MPQQLIRLPEVRARTGLARATIYLYVKQGRFPKPVPLGSPHSVGWVESEVTEWVEAQIRAARPEPVSATA